MNERNEIRLSRFLSLILRHQPEKIGLTLDCNGWAKVDELLSKMSDHNQMLSRDDLIRIVETNSKKRFTFSDDGTRIRANQGHSISVDVELEKQVPPSILYHGTAARFLQRIEAEGLRPMNRQHVHLSMSRETAVQVGSRHGKPVVLTVDAAKMAEDGFVFFISKNGVWLIDRVPSQYLELME